MNRTILCLSGQIVPKARPRVTSNGTFLPHKYAAWKKSAIGSFQNQHQGNATITRTQINIKLIGKHSRRGDLDNISGSILDALVQANVISNDNLTVVTGLSVSLDYQPKTEPYTIVELSSIPEK